MLSAAGPVLAQHQQSQPDLRVETITDYRDFVEIEPVWNCVAEASGLDHPFLEHVWARTWWECFGAGRRLYIVVVRAGDEPIAIAPFMLSSVRMCGVKLRRLGFLYNEHVPRADFLIARRADDVYRAIWNHLAANRCWELLQLCQVPEGSATFLSIRALATEQGWPYGTWLSGASPYIRIDGSWSDYSARLAPKHRSNLRNRLKRLDRLGPVEVRTAASGEAVADALDAGLRIEAAAWKGKAGTAISSDPDVNRFYALLAQRASALGLARLHFLCAGSDRVAFDYSLEYKRQLFLLKLGYDPLFSAYSPSNLLLSQVLQDAFARDVVKYEFLGESAHWKRCWTQEATNNHWLFVFSDTWKGRLSYWLKFRLMPRFKHRSLSALRAWLLRDALPAATGSK